MKILCIKRYRKQNKLFTCLSLGAHNRISPHSGRELEATPKVYINKIFYLLQQTVAISGKITHSFLSIEFCFCNLSAKEHAFHKCERIKPDYQQKRDMYAEYFKSLSALVYLTSALNSSARYCLV
jgi:hypothetical protein